MLKSKDNKLEIIKIRKNKAQKNRLCKAKFKFIILFNKVDFTTERIDLPSHIYGGSYAKFIHKVPTM